MAQNTDGPTAPSITWVPNHTPSSCTSHNITAFAVTVGVFRENRGRSWRHAARIAARRYLLRKVRNASDLKLMYGASTAEMYARWASKSGAEVLTDELSEGATLHWIGPRREDRVLLFLHGAYSPLRFG